MNEDTFLSIAGFGLTPMQQALIAKAAQHQEEIIQVMCVLPGKYRYEQVEAAIRASGVMARDIYESLVANQHTVALARFYAALQGPE